MEKGITIKPPIIDLIAVCFLLAPLMFVLYQFTFSGYNYMNFHRWQWLLTAPNAVFLFSSLVISYAVFTARFWGWLLAVAFQGALFFSSFWTLFMVQTEVTYTWQIGMLQATSVLMVLILFIREIRIPFFNPKTRWWKQDKRFLVSLDMVVKNKEHEISGKTYDLARRGVFMISDEPVEMNERFEIRMKAPGEKTEIEGEGKVVWINEGKAELPIGFGINFLFMELPGSRLVRRFVKDPDQTRIK